MVNNSFFSSEMPYMDYNPESLELDGYNLEYALDPRNEQLQEIIANYKQNRVPIKIIENQRGQTHLWVNNDPFKVHQDEKKCPRCNGGKVQSTGNNTGHPSTKIRVHTLDDYFEYVCSNENCSKKFWVTKQVHTF